MDKKNRRNMCMPWKLAIREVGNEEIYGKMKRRLRGGRCRGTIEFSGNYCGEKEVSSPFRS